MKQRKDNNARKDGRLFAAARKAGACLLSLVLTTGLFPVVGFADDPVATEDKTPTTQQAESTTEQEPVVAPSNEPTAEQGTTPESETDPKADPTTEPADGTGQKTDEPQSPFTVSATFTSAVTVTDGVALVQGTREEAWLTLEVDGDGFVPEKSALVVKTTAGENTVALTWAKTSETASTWQARIALTSLIPAKDAQGVSLKLSLSADEQAYAVALGAPSQATTVAFAESSARAQVLPAFTRIAFAVDQPTATTGKDAKIATSQLADTTLAAAIEIPEGYPEVDGVTYYRAAYNLGVGLYAYGDVTKKTVLVNGEELLNVNWEKTGNLWSARIYVDKAYQETQIELVVTDAQGNTKTATSPTFVLDIEVPKISFAYDRLSDSVVVSVRDAYFDASNTKINNEVVSQEKWTMAQETGGIKAWSTKIPMPAGLDDFSVLVEAADISGRTTIDARTFNRAEMDSWKLDNTPPSIQVQTRGTYVGTRGGIDYFSDFDEFYTTIVEENLSCLTIVTNSSGWIDQEVFWFDVDDGETTHFDHTKLDDLAMGRPTTITFIAIDRAGNTTTYTYGQTPTAGNSTTTDKGEALSGPQLCVIGANEPIASTATVSFESPDGSESKHTLSGAVDYFSDDLHFQMLIEDALGLDWDTSTVTVQEHVYSLVDLVDKNQQDYFKFSAHIALNIPFEGDCSFSITLKTLFGDSKTYSYADLVEAGLVVLAGEKLTGSALVIDKTAPEISLSFDGETPSEGDYLNAEQSATIIVTEANFDESLMAIATSGQVGAWTQAGADTYRATVTFGEGQDHTLSVSGSDKAGNAAVPCEAPRFSIDLTSPVISVAFSETNANNCYNAVRTATVTVKELNFDESLMAIATSGQVSAWTQAGADTYRATVTFGEGQNHRLSVSGNDKAGNAATPYEAQTFNVDLTAPKMSVSFDNNAAQNGTYYNAHRTATIRVDEINFDPSRISIQTTGSIGSWWSEGSSHYVRVSFGFDGNHSLSASGSDLAGNIASPLPAQSFVIDTQVPTIDIQSVADNQAYSQTVAPSVIMLDEANFDASRVSWTLVGSKYGDRSSLVSVSVNTSAAGQTLAFQDFDVLREMDDVYTLTVQVSDLAGNTIQKTITFSVNRFGSSYEVIPSEGWEATLSSDEVGYCDLTWVGSGSPTSAPSVTIREYNVAGCRPESQTVTITRDGEPLLVSSKDTTGATIWKKAGADINPVESSQEGWSVYDYEVPSSLFDQDGEYTMYVSSVDNSDNARSSAYYFGDKGEATSQVVRLQWNASILGDGQGVSAMRASDLLPFVGIGVGVLALAGVAMALYFRKRDEELKRLLAEAQARSRNE